MGETKDVLLNKSPLRREGKGPGDGIPAWLCKTWGAQPGSLLRWANVGAEGAEDGVA